MSTSDRKRELSPIQFGRVGDIELSQVPFLEDCYTGIEEITEYNVLVAPAVMPEKLGSILLADQTREGMDMAMQMGRIIQQSPVAFNFDKWPVGAKPPAVGDIVWFARYGGGEFIGSDGRTYRMIKDKDVMAIIRRKANSAKPDDKPKKLSEPTANSLYEEV